MVPGHFHLESSTKEYFWIKAFYGDYSNRIHGELEPNLKMLPHCF